MALTELIKQPEIRAKFTALCNLSRLEFEPRSEHFVEPRHQNYALVGKAFDYAVRFYLEARQPALTAGGTWIAEQSVELLKADSFLNRLSGSELAGEKTISFLEKCLEKARLQWREYVKTAYQTGNFPPDDAIFRMSLFLAEMDNYYRSGTLDLKTIRAPLRDEINDLRALFGIIPEEEFRAEKHLILNPSFGESSVQVGGADADLIIDDCLMDFKTTKHLSIKPEHIWQIISYQALALQSGVYSPLNEKRWNLNPNTIRSGAIYFARYGRLFKWNFADVIDENQMFELGKFLADFGKDFYQLRTASDQRS